MNHQGVIQEPRVMSHLIPGPLTEKKKKNQNEIKNLTLQSLYSITCNLSLLYFFTVQKFSSCFIN